MTPRLSRQAGSANPSVKETSGSQTGDDDSGITLISTSNTCGKGFRFAPIYVLPRTGTMWINIDSVLRSAALQLLNMFRIDLTSNSRTPLKQSILTAKKHTLLLARGRELAGCPAQPDHLPDPASSRWDPRKRPPGEPVGSGGLRGVVNLNKARQTFRTRRVCGGDGHKHACSPRNFPLPRPRRGKGPTRPYLRNLNDINAI